jgi:lysophospholipase L1-like esterase
MAVYTINVTKIGIVTKQVAGVNGTTSNDTIKVKAVPAPRPVVPMPIISQGVPAYASSNQSSAASANDTSQNSMWTSSGTTAWLAYDLSSKPLAARQFVFVAWYDKSAMDYFFYNGSDLAKDYSIEINMAAGGGSAPATGWITVFAVTGNNHSARQHEINMKGANWVRMRVTAGYTANIGLDMDVYDVSKGVTDFWLIMGDSITFMSMQRGGNNLQNRVHQFKNTAWPGIVEAAEGGTSSNTGLQIMNDVLVSFTGKFITLNYGTNDHPIEGGDTNNTFFKRMDTLCMKIIAAGKTPVIPTVPWPHTGDTAIVSPATVSVAQQKVNMVYQLYAKYPTLVLPGPDLYTFFKNNQSLIGPGDVHPNGTGMEDIRQMWVATMDSTYIK